MLTGLIHPSAGTVLVNQHVPFRRESAFLQDITLVMGQKQQLLWDLPALDSLRINGAIYGLSDKEFRYRVDELTEMLGLAGKTHPTRAQAVSGGADEGRNAGSAAPPPSGSVLRRTDPGSGCKCPGGRAKFLAGL